MIARCTAPEKADRYQSVEEIQHDINHQKRYYHYVSLFVAIIVAVLAVGIALLTHRQDAAPISQESLTDSVSPIQRDSIALPEVNQIPKPSASNVVSDIENIRKDIQKSILPKFNATVGALPDSVMPGSEKWAEACREFEPMITQSLSELITTHQSIPMETIAKEFNDYVQSLLTLKMNQAQKTAVSFAPE